MKNIIDIYNRLFRSLAEHICLSGIHVIPTDFLHWVISKES